MYIFNVSLSEIVNIIIICERANYNDYSYIYNLEHNIVKLFKILANFTFTTSKVVLVI